MKRTRLGPGEKSLERGSTFASQGEEPKRKTELKPVGARKRRSAPPNPNGHGTTWSVQPGETCAVCGNRAVHAHHVTYAQWLRQEGLAHLLWDPRNRMAICLRDHAAHHSAARRIPWSALSLANVEFAKEVGLLARLRRTYPHEERSAA